MRARSAQTRAQAVQAIIIDSDVCAVNVEELSREMQQDALP